MDRLLPHKEAIEHHVRTRLGELFALEYDLLLYDVTSTYFEGLAIRNALAARGHSRDHRPDCKQVYIALAVTRGGIPLGYELFAGNRTDVNHGRGDRGNDGGPLRPRPETPRAPETAPAIELWCQLRDRSTRKAVCRLVELAKLG